MFFLLELCFYFDGYSKKPVFIYPRSMILRIFNWLDAILGIFYIIIYQNGDIAYNLWIKTGFFLFLVLSIIMLPFIFFDIWKSSQL